MNLCGVVQYIDTAAPELQLIDMRSTLFLQKQIVETFLSSTIKNPHIAHPYPRQKSQTGGTGPKGHFSVGPQGAGKDLVLNVSEYLRFLCESGKSENERAGARRVKAAAFNLSLDGKFTFQIQY